MTFLCLSHDFIMPFLWLSLDFLRTFLWLSHDFLMTFLSLSHKFLLSVSIFSYNFLMTFKWPSQDFSWLSYDFLLNIGAVGQCPEGSYFSKHRPSGPIISISQNVHMCVCVCLSVHFLGYGLNVFFPPFLKLDVQYF